MLEKQHHPVAFDITQRVKVHDKQILYVCNSDKEAQFLKNELLLFFETDEIGYYSDREILPYDRFSTTESIIQNRIQLLNGDKNSFKVVVTSCINLFERLTAKSLFQSRKKDIIGDLLSIKELVLALEELNYQRVDKVK